MLYYMPLESYKTRYTSQMSGKGELGWQESRWIENKIPYCRIEPDYQVNENITHGEVLDGCGRGIYSCLQIAELLKLVQQGLITSDDVIYFDDFWTPGIEALPYAFHQVGIRPRMYGFIHAQSVDEFDFTFNMLPWIRHFEKGNASVFDGIFADCSLLCKLAHKQGFAPKDKFHIVGLPYNSEKVIEMVGETDFNELQKNKKNQIVYASRLDKEKNPLFFIEIAKRYYEIDKSVKFIITTPHDELKSNDPEIINQIVYHYDHYDLPNLRIKIGVPKVEYYKLLLESKAHFNCADQDFVSFTLLESLTCGCTPIYPNFRSFPYILPDYFMYNHKDTSSATKKIHDIFTKPVPALPDYVVKAHDKSWERMWHVMFSEDTDNIYSLTNNNDDGVLYNEFK